MRRFYQVWVTGHKFDSHYVVAPNMVAAKLLIASRMGCKSIDMNGVRLSGLAASVCTANNVSWVYHPSVVS